VRQIFFDAVRGIDDRYRSYLTPVRKPVAAGR
jgi:hypothetical protein